MHAGFSVAQLSMHRRLTFLLPLSLLLAPMLAAPANALTPDQQAIIAKIAKPTRTADVLYAGNATDPFGAEVRLPFQQGKFVTLLHKQSNFRDDGSITWVGEVAETGEPPVLMVWG